MPLSEPPADPGELEAFPRVQLRGEPLYRVFRHRDPEDGRVRAPFYFAAGPEEGGVPEQRGGSKEQSGSKEQGGLEEQAGPAREAGRYDLPPPHGSCYLARDQVGACLETFRSALVALDDLRARRMLATRPPYSLRAADLLARAARGFGVTGEIHTTADRGLTRRWAGALHRAGFPGLHGKVRHDPGVEHRSVTLFDDAGERMPYGWRWHTEVSRLEDDGELLEALAEYGYRVLAVPFDVAVERPDGEDAR